MTVVRSVVEEKVIPRSAGQVVVAVGSNNDVIAATTIDRVVVIEPEDEVSAAGGHASDTC